MFAVKGVIQGNTVLVDDAAIAGYDGRNVIVTVLDTSSSRKEKNAGPRRLGIADGKFEIPDNIDVHNDEIAAMFGIEYSILSRHEEIK